MAALTRPAVVSALIAAGGRGVRLGADQPKQFLEIGGRSILERSIERFATHPGIAEVVVALPPDYLPSLQARLQARGWASVRCVEGGGRRQDSVENAFRAARPDATVLAIHDAARPFVSRALIERTVAAAAAHGAAIFLKVSSSSAGDPGSRSGQWMPCPWHQSSQAAEENDPSARITPGYDSAAPARAASFTSVQR